MSSEEECGVEVIVEDGIVSSKPFILLQRTNRSAALRRWKLLKNLTIAQRRFNSLTKHEAAFLDSFSLSPPHPDNTQEEEKDDDDDERMKTARDDLKAFVELNAEKLTAKEKEFLGGLIASRKVTVEYLEKTLSVLDADPLYKHIHHDEANNKEGEEKDDNDLPKDKSEVAKRHHSAAFRSEVWQKCSSASFGSTKAVYDAASVRRMSVIATASNKEEPTLEEEEEEPKQEEEDEATTAPSSFFSAFFSSSTSSSAKQTEQDGQETEEEVPEDDEKYTILATSPEDADCHPHVLSPPIMECLRSHLPYTVRQDNYWLKYSMVRDVRHPTGTFLQNGRFVVVTSHSFVLVK